LTLLLGTLEAGSQGRPVVDSVVNIGPHYAHTLRGSGVASWSASAIMSALMEYPDMMGAESERPKGNGGVQAQVDL
jgi:hypothetical protein